MTSFNLREKLEFLDMINSPQKRIEMANCDIIQLEAKEKIYLQLAQDLEYLTSKQRGHATIFAEYVRHQIIEFKDKQNDIDLLSILVLDRTMSDGARLTYLQNLKCPKMRQSMLEAFAKCENLDNYDREAAVTMLPPDKKQKLEIERIEQQNKLDVTMTRILGHTEYTMVAKDRLREVKEVKNAHTRVRLYKCLANEIPKDDFISATAWEAIVADKEVEFPERINAASMLNETRRQTILKDFAINESLEPAHRIAAAENMINNEVKDSVWEALANDWLFLHAERVAAALKIENVEKRNQILENFAQDETFPNKLRIQAADKISRISTRDKILEGFFSNTSFTVHERKGAALKIQKLDNELLISILTEMKDEFAFCLEIVNKISHVTLRNNTLADFASTATLSDANRIKAAEAISDNDKKNNVLVELSKTLDFKMVTSRVDAALKITISTKRNDALDDLREKTELPLSERKRAEAKMTRVPKTNKTELVEFQRLSLTNQTKAKDARTKSKNRKK